MKRIKRVKHGFTLLELILVLGVGSAVTFMKFQDMVNDQESLKASAAGQQIKQLGDAVNGYINIRYDKLSTLTNGAGTGSDPGPRTCSTADSTCTITYQTLINEGLLPSTYVARNAYGSDYSIQLKRNGTAPNYVIDGIIATNSAWIEGGKTRFDLLGKAMQVAGIDSGMSRSNTQVDGYKGTWNYTSSNFSSINKSGALGYRVGYNSAMYSVYLRRDGTLPMTGALNMGANDINNAKNITASGAGNFGGNINAGGEITAHNGYGDQITLGGDAYGNDYELRLGSAKPLTIYSPNSTPNSLVMNVDGNTHFNYRIATNGLNANDIPTGWGGGIRTFDVISSGTVALIKNGTAAPAGNIAAYMNLNGDIYGSNSVTSGNYITANGRVTAGDIYSNSETYTNSWFRTMGDGGIYFQKYGGGWNMGDTSTINAYGGKNVQTTGGFYGNYVHSNGDIAASGNIYTSGRINSGEFIYINGQSNVGNGCSPNGLLGRTPDGTSISCVNGVWKASSPVVRSYYNRVSAWRWPHAYASCPGGQQMVGGGGNCNSDSGIGYSTLVGSRPANGNTWEVYCDTGQNQNQTAEVWVYCI